MSAGETFDLLWAEALAYPFLGDKAYQAVMTHTPGLAVEGKLSEGEKKLLEGCVYRLLKRGRGINTPRVRGIVERAWTVEGELRGKVPLQELLFCWSRLLLRRHRQGAALRIEPGSNGCQEIHRWRALSRTLPPDLWVAALEVAEGRSIETSEVSIVPPLLERLLERPVAQVHMHVRAGIPFEVLWISAMRRVARDQPFKDGETGWPAVEGAGAWAWRLNAAAVARAVLVAFLVHDRSVGEACFDSYLHRLLSRPDDDVGEWLRALIQGRENVRCTRLPRLLLQTVSENKSLGLEALRTADVARLLAPRQSSMQGFNPEHHLLCAALRYLQRDNASEVFTRLFWQYVRCRSRTYCLVTQEAGVGGLDWFMRFFGVIKPLRAGMTSRAEMEAAIELESRGVAMRSFEARTSPEESADEIRSLVGNLKEAAKKLSNESEYGLVLHFQKKSPELGGLMRCGSNWETSRTQADAMVRLLRESPEVLQVFRGLDACGIEYNLPAWVFSDAIRRVRCASVQASSVTGLPPLRLSVHAGEDMWRLVDGLRRIDEAMHVLGLAQGDRIGHGFALGIDVDAWLRANAVVAQPLQERLDDLVWELSLYRSGRIRADMGRAEVVRREIEQLGEKLGAEKLSADDWVEVRECRHWLALQGDALWNRKRAWGLGEDRGEGVWKEVGRYFFNQQCRTIGEEHVQVKVTPNDGERAFLHAVQDELRRRISELGVVVEVNPSSNFVVGDECMETHPMFRMNPLDSGGHDRIMVAIGDDNPSVHATNLADEYTYVFSGLIGGGASVQSALAWLEQAREAGWLGRFTVERERP